MIAWIREAFVRMGSLFRKPELDRELDFELKDHIERAVEENVRRGMTPVEARREAMIGLGGFEPARGPRAGPV